MKCRVCDNRVDFQKYNFMVGETREKWIKCPNCGHSWRNKKVKI